MKEGKKKTIKSQEISMLQSLRRTPRSLSINELAHKSRLSWSTTDKYLNKWKSKGLIKPVRKSVFSTKFGKTVTKKEFILDEKRLQSVFKKLRKKR